MDPAGIHLSAAKVDSRRRVVRRAPGAFRYDEYVDNERLDTAVPYWAYPSIGKWGSVGYKDLAPVLLRTNKRIHQEALGYLYNRNNFFFATPYALHTFIVNIGTRNAPFLRDLTIVDWIRDGPYHGYSHSCFTAMLLAPNVESLKILGNLCIHWNGAGTRRIARYVFENAFPWLEAVGFAKGKYDAALSILNVSPFNFTTFKNRRGGGNEAVRKAARQTEEENQREFKNFLRHFLRYGCTKMVGKLREEDD